MKTHPESCLWKCEAVRANGGLLVSLRTHTIGHERSMSWLARASATDEKEPVTAIRRNGAVDPLPT